MYRIEKKVPYIIMGGKPISNDVETTDDEIKFKQKMKEVIGEEKYIENENAIFEHLKKPNTFIEFGEYIFSIHKP